MLLKWKLLQSLLLTIENHQDTTEDPDQPYRQGHTRTKSFRNTPSHSSPPPTKSYRRGGADSSVAPS